MVTDQSPDNGGVSRPILPSPWASIVRGDSEQINSPIADVSVAGVSVPASSSPEQFSGADSSVIESTGFEVHAENSDVNGEDNAGRTRRPAWNRPLNGAVEVGPVMGGTVAWPALSESTRPIPRSSSESPRPVSDGSASSSQAPLISHPPRRQGNNNTNAHANNSTANNTTPTRPRSRNRSSGNGPSQNNFLRPSPPPFPVFEVPFGVAPSPMLEASIRGPRPLHNANGHSSPRNNSRRGNYGQGPRGNGSYHQERRDVHIPPPPMSYVPPPPPPMSYMPPPLPPPGAAPYMGPPPPPVRVFPGQMGFDMQSPFIYVPTMHPETFRPMPMAPPPPPPMLYPPANENPLPNLILNQINYYFSDVNLTEDDFLRSNMDENGWVPITLIASFRRVQLLTQDIQLILESLRNSTVVEVQSDKVRRRNEWNKWLPFANSDSGSRTPTTTTEDAVSASLQGVSLEDNVTNSDGNVEETGDGQTQVRSSEVLVNRENDSAGEEVRSLTV